MELLGVVAIIGILSALIAVGVVAYNRSLKVMELNNTAEEIYIAAQNHLTALRTNAAAKDTLDTIGYGTKVSTLSSSGAPADLKDKSQWDAIYAFGNSSASSGTTAASGNAVSSGGTAVSGGAVSSGGTTVSGKGSSNTANYAQLSAYILPAGAVDGTVAGEGNSYIIEYNPKAYTVYGVFYADGKSSVLGRDTGETISVTDDLASLNAEVKADGKTKITSYKPKNSSGSTGICVGYYGGSGAASLKSSTLEGSISVKLVNAEKLYAEITTKKLSVSGADAAAQANKNIRLWLTVTGKTSGAIKTYGCTIDASGEEDKKSIDDAWKKQGKIQRSGSASDMTITRQVVLDDITTTGCHFAEIFGSGKTDNGLNFIPGEDITVSASAAVTDTLSNIVYSNGTQSTNSLFASLQSSSNGTSAASGASGSTSGGNATGKITETVTIANFRHLENLSPRVSHVMRMTGSTDADAAVSLTTNTNNGNSASANLYTSGNFAFKALLTVTGKSASSSDTSKTTSAGSDANSMSWSDFFKNTGHDEINKAGNNEKDFITYVAKVSSTSDKSTSAVTDSTSNGSFSPIENPWLSEFDGNNVTIDGVYISSSDSHNESRGLFGTIDQQCDLTIKNLKLQNFDITSSKMAFADAVSNRNPKLICAGTLAGRIVSRAYTVNIQNVISMENKDDYCGVWCAGNETNIVRNGGLIGELQTASNSNAKITLEKSSASVYVQSSIAESPDRNKQPGLNNVDVAGGLIGHIEGIGGEIHVENSYSGGHTNNALNSPYYSSDDKQRGKKGSGRNICSSGIAGGFVGAVYSNYTQIFMVNDYSTASVACASGKNVVKYSDAGGLIGYVSNNVSKINAQDCYSTGLVEGYNRGGVIGYVALAKMVGRTNPLNSFKSCCFLEDVSTTEDGGDIPAVNILESHADSSASTSQTITSFDKFSGSVYPVDFASLAEKGGKAKAVPYDENLQSITTYPFESGQKVHYGDWPSSGQSFKGDFGVLYYEIVQHGTDKDARDYYYHGFVGDLTEDGSKSDYEEVNTLNTNAQACSGRSYNDHALLTGHDEYVVEEGYLILASKQYQMEIEKFNEENKDKQNTANNESITLEIGGNDGNNKDLTISDKISNGKIEEYDEFLSKAGIIGYQAYAIECGQYASEAAKSVKLVIRAQVFQDSNNKFVKKFSEFYFQPVFSDTLSENDPGAFNTYSIRSAKQLKLMFEKGGNTTTDSIQNGKANLQQLLDISYDSSKVKFTELTFNGKKSDVVNSGEEAYKSPYFTGNFNTSYYSSTPNEQTTASSTQPDADSGAVHYKLDGLNQHFINTLGEKGRMKNVNVTNVEDSNNVTDFIDTINAGGELKNSRFENCSFSKGLIETNHGTITDNNLSHCGGTSFVWLNQNDSAKIQTITMYDSSFKTAVIKSNYNNAQIDTINAYSLETSYFVEDNGNNNSKITNVSIENAHFNNSNGGFVGTNGQQATVSKCSIEYADFEGFGFVNDNQGKIMDCHISDAVIEFNGNQYGGGFVCNNSGTITNCQIYSNGFDNYRKNYLTKYDSQSRMYNPLHFNIDSNQQLQAGNPEDAYDLVTVGIRGNFANTTSAFTIDTGVKTTDKNGKIITTEGIGGFAYQNQNNNNESITNCSFTGCVFGSVASGFVYKNDGNIVSSYANAYDHGTSYSCGFMYTNTGNSNQNHALGKILRVDDGDSGTGFIKENRGGVENSYSAVWDENVGNYQPFVETSNGTLNNNFATKMEKNTNYSDNSSVTYVTDDQLRNYTNNVNMLNLGGKPTNGTSAYAEYLKNTDYPYPMPVYKEIIDGKEVDKTLKAYGDWKTSDGLILEPSEIDTYIGDVYDLNNIKAYFNHQIVSINELQWNDNLSQIVTLENNSGLKGIKEGTATITVSYGGTQNDGTNASAQLTVNVLRKSVKIQMIENGGNTDITGSTQTGYVGDSINLSAVLLPAGSSEKIIWTSSDSTIASVTKNEDDGSAELKCLQNGKVTITAKATSNDYAEASFMLNVANKYIQIYYNNNPVPEGGITLASGERASLEAVTLPDNTATNNVTWSSDNMAVVSIDPKTGALTVGQTPGKATITASCEGFDAGTCVINVLQKLMIAGGKINATKLNIHSSGEYTSQQGYSIMPGAIIKDNIGNYCLVYGNQTYYELQNLTTVQEIAQKYQGNVEVLDDNSTVIEVGEDKKIPNPSNAGTIFHYVNNGTDEYYVAKQSISYDTTIDDKGNITKIGIQ